jgi:hypothetical protein
MIKTKEGEIDIKGLTVEVMADISVIIQTLRQHKLMSDDRIMIAVINGFNDNIVELSPEEEDKMEDFLKNAREKAEGEIKYGN